VKAAPAGRLSRGKKKSGKVVGCRTIIKDGLVSTILTTILKRIFSTKKIIFIFFQNRQKKLTPYPHVGVGGSEHILRCSETSG
jgi:hypothetical protein